MNSFSLKFQVKWSDVDPNMHLRNSVYMDFTDQVRIKFFHVNGISLLDFRRMHIGPILFSTTTNFRREILINEEVKVNCKLAMMTEDGRKWEILHEVFKENGELAATVIASGAWMDLTKRKLTTPPVEIVRIFDDLERVEKMDH